MLKRVTAATAFPVTLPQAKTQCRIGAGENDFDDDLDRLIATANEVIGEDTGIVLGDEEWELTVTDAYGILFLPKSPIKALVSVKQGEATLSGFSLTMIGDRSGVVGDWPAGEVVIRFKAGGDVPLALTQAMLLLIKHWFENRDATAEKPLHELPYAVESLVSRHRRKWVTA